MTDSERNQIETEAETFMKTSSEAIKMFKLECRQTLIKYNAIQYNSTLLSRKREMRVQRSNKKVYKIQT